MQLHTARWDLEFHVRALKYNVRAKAWHFSVWHQSSDDLCWLQVSKEKKEGWVVQNRACTCSFHFFFLVSTFHVDTNHNFKLFLNSEWIAQTEETNFLINRHFSGKLICSSVSLIYIQCLHNTDDLCIWNLPTPIQHPSSILHPGLLWKQCLALQVQYFMYRSNTHAILMHCIRNIDSIGNNLFTYVKAERWSKYQEHRCCFFHDHWARTRRAEHDQSNVNVESALIFLCMCAVVCQSRN